jgi:hypothetical protein
VVATPVKFLIDESSLREPLGDVHTALEIAHSRILAVRGDGVGKLSLIWEELIEGYTLAEWLFNKELGLDPLVAQALRIALDRSPNWDDVLDTTDLPLEVSINGVQKAAWSVGAAATFTQRSTALGCVALVGQLGPRTISLNLNGSNEQVEVWFVGDETTALGFFRELPEVEDLDEDGFFENAQRAFPRIQFFRERTRFGAFDEEYRTIRLKVGHHFAVLNDHAADIFKRKLEPREIQAELGARGVEASGESPNTKADARAMRQRKICFDGGEITLDWHTKVRSHLDRIYFSATAKPYVIVGVFHKHLD